LGIEGFVIKNAGDDILAGYKPWMAMGKIVCMAVRSGRIIDQENVLLFRPRGNLLGVMFVGRNKHPGFFRGNSVPGEASKVGLEIGGELIPGDQQLGKSVPGGIKEMLFRVGTDVVAILIPTLDDRCQIRPVEELAGQKQSCLDAVFAKSLRDLQGGLAVATSGEDQRKSFPVDGTPDDASPVIGQRARRRVVLRHDSSVAEQN
jgi:hypothetical protein